MSVNWSDYSRRIKEAKSLEALEALRIEIFGRKAGVLSSAMKDLSGLSDTERREKGAALNAIKTQLDSDFSDAESQIRSAALAQTLTQDTLDPTLTLPSQERGHTHPIHDYIAQAEEVFGRMGFDIGEGPEVETEANQFDLLNFPKDHAARDAQDIFYLDKDGPPDNRWLLRGHTSTVQIRYMKTHKPPFRMICAGKVYRKDSDATHSPMFHQIEGLMIGKDVSLANMKAVMETAVHELVSPDTEFRWRIGCFPFVEPGLEMDLRWKGDESKSREGKWLEVVGCGMVHPNVLKNVGIDPDEYQGFAFGFGVERMLMIRHQIPDLRLFFGGDLRFLRQF